MELDQFIKRALLHNALKHNGKAVPKAVVGAVLREYPENRSDTRALLERIVPLADEINSMTAEQQKQLLSTLGGSGAPEKETKDPFILDHMSPIVRFEPSPSGAMHIGHAYPLGLNALLAMKNHGILILRIGDTNPENIDPDAYALLEEDARWLTKDHVHQVVVQSERMLLYYSYVEKMLANGWAYVCTSDHEEVRKMIHDMRAPPDRDLPPAIQLERWELMKTEYEPGDAIVRIKTDLQHKNPAMRDWPAFRINTSAHVKQGTQFRVWPLMNFAVSVDDMELGVTHVLRAKDHADNAKRQEYMYRYFDKPIPLVYNVGKINFTDLRLKTSEVRKHILEGTYAGWDDVQLPFLPALRRRGYQPDALLRVAEEMGISSADKTVSKKEYFTNLNAFNRELIDIHADRAFFIEDPLEIEIQEAPIIVVERDLHPDARQGGRKLELTDTVIVPGDELVKDATILYRLMDAYNFRYQQGAWVYVSDSLDDFKKAPKKRILHYLPTHHKVIEVSVLMPDGTEKNGIAENHVQYYANGKLMHI